MINFLSIKRNDNSASRAWLTLLVITALAGCGGGSDTGSGGGGGGGGATVESVDDIVVPADFTYKSDKSITLLINVTDAGGNGYNEVTVNLYDGKDALTVPATTDDLVSEDAAGDQAAEGVTDDHLLLTGITDNSGSYYVENVKIPAYVSTLYVTASAMGFNATKEVDLSAVADGGSVNVTLQAD